MALGREVVEFYPGSKMERKIYDGEEQEPAPTDEDEFLEALLADDFKGTGFYTVGTLAKALGREPVTIRKWEADGVIPKPTLVKTSTDPRGRRRLYTKAQVLGLRELAKQEGILSPTGTGKYKPITETNFKARALELFRTLEAK
jgi:hypothetical protein